MDNVKNCDSYINIPKATNVWILFIYKRLVVLELIKLVYSLHTNSHILVTVFIRLFFGGQSICGRNIICERLINYVQYSVNAGTVGDAKHSDGC
jgi:hypothetical protein